MKKDKKSNTKNNVVSKELKKSRRDFIKTAWKGLGVVAGLEMGGLTLHYLVDRKETNHNIDLFEVGLPDEYPLGTVTPFRRGRFFLIRMNDGGFLAISFKCSHLGCSIIWDEKIKEFVCPCHSSKFSIAGDVINPPAPRALDVFEIRVTEGKLFVNLNKKIKRDEFEKSQLTYV